MKNSKIANLRKEYQSRSLDIAGVAPDPIRQFTQWFEEALASGQKEPNAMTLASCTKAGIPSARIVLLKGFDQRGFVFYTNYESRKGKELSENPHAALVFCWLELERQIRIEGSVVKIDPIDSDQYFRSRPKASQIGAVASPQSTVIKDRSFLTDQVAVIQKQYEEKEQLPRPDHWGGFRVIPNTIEFWQGRPSRLHDRIQYILMEQGDWKIQRLAP